MRGVSRSFDEQFAVRIVVGNPYTSLQDFAVRVYDQNFETVEAKVSRPIVRVPPGDTRSVTVIVAFDGAVNRKVRVCAEGLFPGENNTAIRTQVCGRFLGQHFTPQP